MALLGWSQTWRGTCTNICYHVSANLTECSTVARKHCEHCEHSQALQTWLQPYVPQTCVHKRAKSSIFVCGICISWHVFRHASRGGLELQFGQGVCEWGWAEMLAAMPANMARTTWSSLEDLRTWLQILDNWPFSTSLYIHTIIWIQRERDYKLNKSLYIGPNLCWYVECLSHFKSNAVSCKCWHVFVCLCFVEQFGGET